MRVDSDGDKNHQARVRNKMLCLTRIQAGGKA